MRSVVTMEAFLTVDQFHLIRKQAKAIVNALSTTTDKHVQDAAKTMAYEKATENLESITSEQKDRIDHILQLKNKEDMEEYLLSLKEHVIPFPEISEQRIRMLFPKIKKLKAPDLSELDFKETVYLRWFDKGLNKSFLIVPFKDKFIGVQGYLETTQHKGICSICNGLEEVSLFTSEKKGKIRGTYSKKGNYICKDPAVCNGHLSDRKQLNQFIENLK